MIYFKNYIEDLAYVEKSLKTEDVSDEQDTHRVSLNRHNFQRYCNQTMSNTKEIGKRKQTLYSKLCKFHALKYNNNIRELKHIDYRVTILINALKNNEIKNLQFFIKHPENFHPTMYDIRQLVTNNTISISLFEEQSRYEFSYLEFIWTELETNTRFRGVKNLTFHRISIEYSGGIRPVKRRIHQEKRRKIFLTELIISGKLKIKNINFIELETLILPFYGTGRIELDNCKLRCLKKLVGLYDCSSFGLEAFEYLHNFIIECECKSLQTVLIFSRSGNKSVTLSYQENEQKENIIKKIKNLCPDVNFKV